MKYWTESAIKNTVHCWQRRSDLLVISVEKPLQSLPGSMKTIGEDNKLSLEIKQLTNQLEQTRIQQDIIEKKLARICRELDHKEDQRTKVALKEKTRKVIDKEESEYSSENILRLGDSVWIINPKLGQCDRGVIKGFCVDGKAKVHTYLGSVITRQPKNLRYQGSSLSYVEW